MMLIVWYETPGLKRTLRAPGGIAAFPVPGEGTDVRACVSSFQNMKRTTGIPEPRITVVVLRWRVGVCVFGRRCFK
jgi:hypothetical protein